MGVDEEEGRCRAWAGGGRGVRGEGCGLERVVGLWCCGVVLVASCWLLVVKSVIGDVIVALF